MWCQYVICKHHIDTDVAITGPKCYDNTQVGILLRYVDLSKEVLVTRLKDKNLMENSITLKRPNRINSNNNDLVYSQALGDILYISYGSRLVIDSS